MAKIIMFEPFRKKHEEAAPSTSCDHKDVVAYTATRTVHCATCDAILDPYDVMLELLKGATPPVDSNRELKLFSREMARRASRKRPKG